MGMKKLGITTDSVSDLPTDLVKKYDIGIIRFYVITETGVFRDGDEITSQNVAEYYEKGGATLMTDEASPEEYEEFFRGKLEKYEEIIHITISAKASHSYERATAALGLLGSELAKRVRLVDSETLSTGMAYLVIKAAEMRDNGSSTDEIVKALEEMREHICVSFISRSPEQMFRNGRMSKAANRLCRYLRVHPIFSMKKGRVVLSGVGIGDMAGASKRYVKQRLRRQSTIDTERLFITYAGCALSELNAIKKEVEKRVTFDEIIINPASATVSGNSGAGTFGLLYVKKY